uniref:Uncharacterized protein n=1 Tax=Rhizophora mucronata TaxID=61149 RepID=A0A2P2P8G8_RHIMU
MPCKLCHNPLILLQHTPMLRIWSATDTSSCIHILSTQMHHALRHG